MVRRHRTCLIEGDQIGCDQKKSSASEGKSRFWFWTYLSAGGPSGETRIFCLNTTCRLAFLVALRWSLGLCVDAALCQHQEAGDHKHGSAN